MSNNVKLEYTLIDRENGKVLNVHSSREDARSEKRDWKAEGFQVDIIQSRFQHVFSKVVR